MARPSNTKSAHSDSVRIVGTTDQFVYTSSTGWRRGAFSRPWNPKAAGQCASSVREVATISLRASRRWATDPHRRPARSRSSGCWRSKALSWAWSASTTRSSSPSSSSYRPSGATRTVNPGQGGGPGPTRRCQRGGALRDAHGAAAGAQPAGRFRHQPAGPVRRDISSGWEARLRRWACSSRAFRCLSAASGS